MGASRYFFLPQRAQRFSQSLQRVIGLRYFFSLRNFLFLCGVFDTRFEGGYCSNDNGFTKQLAANGFIIPVKYIQFILLLPVIW